METNNHKSENGNRSNGSVNKQDSENKIDQPGKNKNEPNKKPVYIKDMPPIDGARTGII